MTSKAMPWDSEKIRDSSCRTRDGEIIWELTVAGLSAAYVVPPCGFAVAQSAPQMLRLADILPKLPTPEGRLFFASLGSWWASAAEDMLNIVGEQSFIEHWAFQKGEIERLSWSFGPELDHGETA
jgi:hypothetical protein